MKISNYCFVTPNKKYWARFVSSFILILTVQFVFAHGTVTSPPSRVYNCYLENPENPTSAPCIAAVASHGSQPLYDWNEINQGNANGQHMSVVPDGNLASGGRPDKYGGMDQISPDWVATPVTAGAFTVTWTNSAPHATAYYRVYITNQTWTPGDPLTWASLTLLVETAPSGPESTVDIPVTLPSRTGKHVLYSVWQRSDSPEAFYAASDVDFGVVLPVDLISFNANLSNNNDVELAWLTASEENNAYFEVEHSVDGLNFNVIERITGEGSTIEAQQYRFVDKAPSSGVNYYRLRQVSFDGTFEYSPIEVINLKPDITIYPTIANDLIHIVLKDEAKVSIEFQVFDIAGRYVQSAIIEEGKLSVDYSIADLVNGSYFIRFSLDGATITKQFVKM